LSEQILTTTEFSATLRERCISSRKSIRLFSAFIKRDAIEWMSQNIRSDVDVCVMSRWRLNDILSGVSDLSVYQYCRSRGWRFGIDLNLHAKTYIFDGTHVLIGSSNITNSAFGLARKSNNEIGVAITPIIEDLSKLSAIESNAFWLDDETFSEIEACVTSEIDGGSDTLSAEWPSELMVKITCPIETLWVMDLPQMPSSLAVGTIGGEQSLRSEFLNSRVYSWIIRNLETEDHTYTNFGWLTSKLHDALIDDPKPFRKNVKDYVSYLFDWIERFAGNEIEIIKYKRTSSLLLKKSISG
jgi:hypothetical protein